VAVDVAGGLRMVVRPYRRSSWLSVQLSGPGTEGRYAPVHVDRMLDFIAALREVAAGRAEAATLASLGRASELVVGLRTVSGHLARGHHQPGLTFSLSTPPTTPGRLYAALRPHGTAWSR
jgi:hypothetical protein